MAKDGKKRRRLQKKAPGAPKRGKSPYILFSMEKREQIKRRLPPGSKVTDVMKAIAAAWSNMTEEDKIPWKEAAESDKLRYEEEMATYEGPLRVPNKRQKKHPDAPKRAASAFLFYSQDMRARLKQENPGMKNTEISKLLGVAWAKAGPAEKAPYIQKEKEDRDRYTREIEVWNANKPERELAERAQAYSAGMQGGMQVHGYDPEDFVGYGAAEV